MSCSYFGKAIMPSLEQFRRKVKATSSVSSQNLCHGECRLSCCRSDGTVSLLQPDFKSLNIVLCRNCMKLLGDRSWPVASGTDGSVLPSAATSVSRTSSSWRCMCGQVVANCRRRPEVSISVAVQGLHRRAGRRMRGM
jgi:hypothetical protein